MDGTDIVAMGMYGKLDDSRDYLIRKLIGIYKPTSTRPILMRRALQIRFNGSRLTFVGCGTMSYPDKISRTNTVEARVGQKVTQR